MPTKKKPKADKPVETAVDPREPLLPTAANFQLVLAEMKAVLADLPPPPPPPAAPVRSKAAAPSSAAPSSAVPSTAVPSTAVPSQAAPANGEPSEPATTLGEATPADAARASKAGSTEGAEQLPQLDLVDALLHFYFADGLPCGYGQEARRRIAEGFVDRNEFRVTEAFEVEDMLRDLGIPDLFDRCLAVRDSIAQIYNDQNGVSLGFLREAGISDRNTFFQRVPAVQPRVVTYLTNLLVVEELCFSDKSTLRAQQRLGIEPKDTAAIKFLDELRALMKPYGHLPLDVGPHLASRKPNTKHVLSPVCLLVRLAPAGKRR